jgi:hypothetical protein
MSNDAAEQYRAYAGIEKGHVDGLEPGDEAPVEEVEDVVDETDEVVDEPVDEEPADEGEEPEAE